MRFINSKTHGIFDYLISVILIAIPFVFHLDKKEPETWLPICMGLGQIPIIFFTKYEVGVIGGLKMNQHLNLDLLAGIFLAASPWIFGFYEIIYLPHFITGLVVICMSLFTQKEHAKINPAAFDSSKA
jgi:hypothetical protein